MAKQTREQYPAHLHQLEQATEALAALTVEAVRVLQEGMQTDDYSIRIKCATAVLTHAARLEDFKHSRLELEPSLVDSFRY